MNLTTLTIADLYAIKSEAKGKEEQAKVFQYANIEPEEKTKKKTEERYWGDLVFITDQELVKRINSL